MCGTYTLDSNGTELKHEIFALKCSGAIKSEVPLKCLKLVWKWSKFSDDTAECEIALHSDLIKYE